MTSTGFTMVLADSDAHVAEVTAKFLGVHGVRVTVVTDGSMVVREIERSASYSALVIAANLVGAPALEVCEQARVIWSQLAIVVTGADAKDERVRALLAGADDYVRRPYTARDLIERVGTILRRRSAFPLISAR